MKNVGCVSALNYEQCKTSCFMLFVGRTVFCSCFSKFSAFFQAKMHKDLILLIQKYIICEECMARFKYAMLKLSVCTTID